MVNLFVMIEEEMIAKKLEKLAHGESMPWTEVADLLDRIEKAEYWAKSSNSFTEWLKSNAEKLGNKESTLWRYLVVGRYYHELREQFSRVKLEYPPLLELPKHVSPEKLELLAKLGRVAPKDFFEKLIYDVLDNAITRDDIREQWRAFRPALKGKTARGRGTIVPLVNLKNKDEYDSVLDGTVINALKGCGAKWLGSSSAQMYEVKMYVELSPRTSIKALDAVILHKKNKNSDLEIHIIEIMGGFLRHKEMGNKISNFSKYCDYLWIAVSNNHKDMCSKNLLQSVCPDYVGILEIENSNVSVAQKAKPCKKDYVKANELLKVLLLKESR